MGIACEVEHRGELHPLTERKIRRGTSNFTKAAAMTRQEVLTAILTGIDAVRVLKEQGYRLFAVGEMGIGNTTTSSAVASVLLQKDPELVTGAGAGLDSAGLETENGGNPAWNRTASPGSHGWHGGIAKGRRIRSGGDGRCFWAVPSIMFRL